jgi:DNA gyrase subunit B
VTDFTWTQEYEKGANRPVLSKKGEATDETGTTITFYPDATIFNETKFDYDWVVNYLRHQAYLTKGVKASVTDERSGQSYAFTLKAASNLCPPSKPRQRTVDEDIFYIEKQVGDGMVEVALQYTDSFVETVMAFANNVYNMDGGSHLNGLPDGLNAGY